MTCFEMMWLDPQNNICRVHHGALTNNPKQLCTANHFSASLLPLWQLQQRENATTVTRICHRTELVTA
ncbi:hypothetical protein A2U01_0076795, partial [Trifolium medium]|nr:hypothetical protein [Trifolium medium]